MNNKRLTAARKIAERIRSTLDSVAAVDSHKEGVGGVVSRAWEQTIEGCMMRDETALAGWVTGCVKALGPIIETCFEDHCYQRLPDKLGYLGKASNARGRGGGRGTDKGRKLNTNFEHVPVRAGAVANQAVCVLSNRKCFVPQLAKEPPKAVVSLSQHIVRLDERTIRCYLSDVMPALRTWFPTGTKSKAQKQKVKSHIAPAQGMKKAGAKKSLSYDDDY
jgi:hypothetical protein